MRRTWIIFACTIVGIASIAQANVNLEFWLQNGSLGGYPGWLLSAVSSPMNPSPTYSLTSPGGHFTSAGNPVDVAVHSDRYSTFSDLCADADGVWTLSLTPAAQPGGGTPAPSVYRVGVNLDIPASQMVTTQPIAPFPGQAFTSEPTFTWPSGLDFYSGSAEVNNGDLTRTIAGTTFYSQATSWSPGPLPDGDYFFQLDLYGPAYNSILPIGYELISGPDLGFVNAKVFYGMHVSVPFSVPEPNLMLIVACAMLIGRRRKR